MSAEDFEVLRQHMLAEISAETFHVSGLIGKATLDERVMTAMGKVPRHEFVPIELQQYAYANIPLPIGFDKTISQPFIVALMTDLYQAAELLTLQGLNEAADAAVKERSQ
jgi:protein-L-isoaspartate(D-aspartate) O-methyltransferase